MTALALHPGFALILAALVLSIAPRRLRKVVLVGGCVAALAAWTRLDVSSTLSVDVAGYRLSFLHVDATSLVFGLVFALVTLLGTVYALHNDNRVESVATLVYAGGALGVVFAGDFVTLFVFWELMAISSLFVIWEGRSERAAAAGYRYLLVHVSGGSLLFAGILLHLSRGGSPAVGALTSGGEDRLAFWLILLGVAVNAAIPPLHAWLTDAYPEASVTGSVFLSAFTTKTAVYVLLRLFPGADVLVWAGVTMALYGVVYAVLENDIRRLLAYHIISQVGYMVAGVGLGTELALDGATAHAFSHILYKALLFMGTGAVIYATGLRKLTELGGIARHMKVVVALYTVGAFSISGVPLFNGFISKSMIISAAAESHRGIAELLLTLASVGTFLHTGLKLPYFTFFGRPRDVAVRPVPWNMILGMALAAGLCTLFGMYPGLLYRMLPFGGDYHPYTLVHVVSSLQLLVGTAIAFYFLLDRLGGERTISLDTDWFYRVPLARLVAASVAAARNTGTILSTAALGLVRGSSAFFLPSPPSEDEADPRGDDYDPNRFRSPIGVTVFWIAVYLVVIAVAAFLHLPGR
jgi:multicomponent Na+:H+ antiporter subunit D